MNAAARSFCFRALAYLKVETTPEEGEGVPLLGTHSPVLRRLGHGLLAAYLVDEGEHFAYVQGRHLHEAGLSPDDLHQRSLANLTSFAEQQIDVHEYGHIFACVGSMFSASMLLCDDFWNVWYADLAPGGFLAMLPARQILAFGDITRPDTLTELCALYEDGRPWRDHGLSATLFCRSGRAWEPLQGSADARRIQ